MRFASLVLAAALGVALLPAPAQEPVAAPSPPVAAPSPPGDAFRPLEDSAPAESQAFYREQGARARASLDRIPGRAEMLERIRKLSGSNAWVTSIKMTAGTRIFYLKLSPGQASPALCMRDGLTGAERLVVDPERFTRATARAAIDWFTPSPDGRHVAYGVSLGGSEDSVLRVAYADSSRDLPIEIDRARFNADLAWHPDSRGFYYARIPEGAKRFANVRIYRHLLGRDSARDEIVFAPGVGGARDVPEFVYPSLHLPQESRYAYAIARDGARNELAVHVAEQSDLAAGRPRWRKLVGYDDQVIAIEGWKDDLYLLSRRDAPNFRVLRVKANAPSLASARVVVPEGDAVIQEMGLAKDALYLRTAVGGVDRLERAPIGLLGTKAREYVKTPFDNGISELVTHPRSPGAILRMEGWIDTPAVVHVEAKSGDIRNTRLQPPAPLDFSGIDEVRLYATAPDGARIPVTLLYRKSTTLNGQNPALLVGYGSYGATMRARFDPARLAWLERGGVYAIAHVRGGGEYGPAWHEGGRRARKLNTVVDFLAAAEFLVKYGFTNPQKLAIEATGAGGIPIGGALVRRPDLFAAVVAHAPLFDMLRYEAMASGPMSVPEFGTASTPEALEVLRAASAYQQLKDATAYPAVLLTVGMNDSRVDAWQSAKMAARLQQATSSGKPVLLRVDFDAGHGPGATIAQHDAELADVYSFLLWQFGDPAFQPTSAAGPAGPTVDVAPAPAGVQLPGTPETTETPEKTPAK